MKQYRFKAVILMCIIALMIPSFSFGLEKGTYSVKNETSYANPKTGKAEDGGTQIALGDSMSRSMLGEYFLMDIKSKKQKYVTIRVGLQKYVSDIKVYVKNSKGEYKEVKIKEKAHNKKNDTRDYKFAVSSDYPQLKIKAYVEPMERDVIFFAKALEKEVKKGKDTFEKTKLSTKISTPAGK
ncbi:MAG: heme-binding Shp domain-containing protein [Filifactor alocis]|nr:heme-binding Shp domain-containing protein [Filifactor alocis]